MASRAPIECPVTPRHHPHDAVRRARPHQCEPRAAVAAGDPAPTSAAWHWPRSAVSSVTPPGLPPPASGTPGLNLPPCTGSAPPASHIRRSVHTRHGTTRLGSAPFEPSCPEPGLHARTAAPEVHAPAHIAMACQIRPPLDLVFHVQPPRPVRTCGGHSQHGVRLTSPAACAVCSRGTGSADTRKCQRSTRRARPTTSRGTGPGGVRRTVASQPRVVPDPNSAPRHCGCRAPRH